MIDPAEGQIIEVETDSLGKQYYTSRTELSRDKFYNTKTSMKVSDANIFGGGTGLRGTNKQPAYAKTDTNGTVTLDGSETEYNIK